MGYVMWTCTSLLPHLGSGPVWERTYEALFGRPCANAAWTNLLFLNNFSDPNDMVRTGKDPLILILSSYSYLSGRRSRVKIKRKKMY